MVIHRAPPGAPLPDGRLGRAVGELAALRLATRAALVRDAAAEEPRLPGSQGSRLTLRLHNQARPAPSPARMQAAARLLKRN